MNRVYITGPREPESEYLSAVQVLKGKGYDVVPRLSRNPTLRLEIATLCTCDAICLLDDWWTDHNANALQTVSAWFRMPILSPTTGEPFATMGGKHA